MDTEFVKFIVFFVIILCAIARRFYGHDEEIMELKKRINKLENKKDNV